MFDQVGQTPLVLACRMDDVDMVRMLLDWGANHQGYSQDGQKPANSPLSCACSDGYLDVVQVLVDRGLNPFESKDEKRPPVWDAFFWGKWGVARYLVDIAPARGQAALDTTLVMACRFSGYGFQSLIIDRGADVNGFDPFDGVTPLVAAATWGSPEVVSLLLERGADPHFVNGEPGVSVLDCVLRISGKQESHARSALILAQAMGLTPLSKVNGKTLLTSFSNASAKEAVRDAQRAYRAKLMAESIDGAMGEVGDSPLLKKSSLGSSGLSL
jgi:ankyrin repeat protein